MDLHLVEEPFGGCEQVGTIQLLGDFFFILFYFILFYFILYHAFIVFRYKKHRAALAMEKTKPINQNKKIKNQYLNVLRWSKK